MTYRSLIVCLDLGESNIALLETTRDLADKFDAHVIGTTVRQTSRRVYSGVGDGFINDQIVKMDLSDINQRTEEAELTFRAAFSPRSRSIEWRPALVSEPLSDAVARQARSADLIIVGAGPERSPDPSRQMDIGALVMKAGRPVLIVPHGASKLKLRSVMIGWKNTREARRAISDALPLAKIAEHVTVVAIADKDDLAGLQTELTDVVDWLKLHSVTASPVAAPRAGEGFAALDELAQRHEADLIIAGAYGHSRLMEWALGGVTRDLILNSRRAMLMSH